MLPPGRVSVDRLSGLLARTMGRLDEAVDHFEDSAYFCRRAGYRPELAWTCFDNAGTLVQRDAPQDRVWALTLLDETEGISAELGMKPLSEQAAALRDLIESQPTDAPKYPDGLTPREVEVLRLVAAGKSNPVIAAELFISLNTVTRHLVNAFSKIGCSNRAEAAVYTFQRGLL